MVWQPPKLIGHMKIAAEGSACVELDQ